MKNTYYILLLRTLMLLVVLFYSSNAVAQAPDFEWVKKIGGADNIPSEGGDFAKAIEVDNNGNLYVGGGFVDTINLGNITLINEEGRDGFISKLDALGNILWAKQIKGGLGESRVSSIAVDPMGYCYIAGTFRSTAVFDSITLSANYHNIKTFIAKVSPAGEFLWAIQDGGNGTNYSADITLDDLGNIYVTGHFNGTVNFGSYTFNSTSYSSSAVFVAKYNNAGSLQSAFHFKSTDMISAMSITTDITENIILTGNFSGTAVFGSNTLTSNGALFLIKTNAIGNVIWAKIFGGQGSGGNSAVGTSVLIDGADNLILTGKFSGSTNFANTIITSNGANDAFLAKFNSAGTLIWATPLGASEVGFAHDLAIDHYNNYYVAGHFIGEMNFNNSTLIGHGLWDIFICKVNTLGIIEWQIAAGGPGSDDGYSIAIDSVGGVYTCGRFHNHSSFGTNSISSNGGNDMFIAKLSSTITGLPSSPTTTLSTYPNPFSTSFQISLTGTAPATVTLTDMLGRQMHRQVISAEAGRESASVTPPANLSLGMYVLQVKQGENIHKKRVVRQ